MSKGIDPTKSNRSKECMICYYWSFNQGFEFQGSVCNSCHDLTILCLNIRNIAIINVNVALLANSTTLANRKQLIC